LDTSKLKDAPDGEAKYVLYGNMRQAVTALSWREFLKDVVWRDRDSWEALQVRVTVDSTKEYVFPSSPLCRFRLGVGPERATPDGSNHFEPPQGVASWSSELG